MDLSEISRKLQEREDAMMQAAEVAKEGLEQIGAERTVEWIVAVLNDQIHEFHESLPADKEIHMRIPGYGQVKPRQLYTDGSETLVIKGDIEGSGRAVIIQNISQINLALVEAAKKDPQEPSKRLEIGFLKH